MLIAGLLRGPTLLMRVAAVADCCFMSVCVDGSYASCWFCLLLNAISIGILAGISALLSGPDHPGQAGSATTLYTNTTAWADYAGSLAGVWLKLEPSPGRSGDAS